MRRVLCLLVTALASSSAYSPEDTLRSIFSSSPGPLEQTVALVELIGRVLGEEAVSRFSVTVHPSLRLGAKDTFTVVKAASEDVVVLKGSTGVAAALGLNHYLKYLCHLQLSWETRAPLVLPQELPPVNWTRTVLHDGVRWYQNVCTWSYSYTWWGWAEWERHVDWMALQGVNMALAFAGQEFLWRRVYTELDLSRQDIEEHFTGPAFLAWQRMGNVRGWGGPLPHYYSSWSVDLNKKLVARMRALGMVPVLPAFSGQVPRGFDKLFPHSNLTKLAKWNNFEDEYCCPYLLSPEDPLFKTIGSLFLNEVVNTFGTDHVYACDTFNEMVPASGDLDYLRSVGRSVYATMANVDPKAIWLMQGWLFHHEAVFWTKQRAQALLTSAPQGKMVVLDLHSEYYPQYQKLDSYFGQPFVWCMLHNFGGTLGLHGSVEAINKGVLEARRMANSTMIGIGITPEGIGQNYVMYDLMLEMSLHATPLNLSAWFESYAIRRYGVRNEDLIDAWQILMSSVYNYTGIVSNHGKYTLVHSPSLYLVDRKWYSGERVFLAWDKLLSGGQRISGSPAYDHDLVDVTRQALQVLLDSLYQEAVQAYNAKNLQALRSAAEKFNKAMEDLDRILASNYDFLLGPWIENAKKFGQSILETELLERNARNQITLWGPNGEIRDYACKQWSGLVADYYAPRWALFWASLGDSLANKTKFRQSKVRQAIFQTIELPFMFALKEYPTSPSGDPLQISEELHETWRPKHGESAII